MLQVVAALVTCPDPRGILHQLRGRAGLDAGRAPSDLRSRVLHAIGRLKSWGSVEGMYCVIPYDPHVTEVLLPGAEMLCDPVGAGFHRAYTDKEAFEAAARLMTPLSDEIVETRLAWLPGRGQHDRLEPYLLWVGMQFDAFFDLPGARPPTKPRLWLVAFHQQCSYVVDRIDDIIDWVEAENVDLYTYTWADAVIASREWHARFASGSRFRSPVPAAVVLATWPDGGRVDRLATRQDLAAEGTSMGHCIGGPLDKHGVAPGTGHYWQELRDGRSTFLSYRDPDGVPQVTAELINPDPSRGLLARWSVNQIQGPEDSRLTDDNARARMAWFLLRVLNIPPDHSQIHDRLLAGSPSFQPDDDLIDKDTDTSAELEQAANAVYELIMQDISIGPDNEGFEHIDRSRSLTAATRRKIEAVTDGARVAAIDLVYQLQRELSGTTAPLRDLGEDTWRIDSPYLGVPVTIRWAACTADMLEPPYSKLPFLGFLVSVPEKGPVDLLSGHELVQDSRELTKSKSAHVTSLVDSLEANCVFIGVHDRSVRVVSPDEQPGTIVGAM